MQDSPHDRKDSYYDVAIRTRITAALRDRFRVTEPMPDRLDELLKELDADEDDQPSG